MTTRGAITPTVPGMWVRDYRRDWLGSDLVAGAVAACVVVPQAIA